MRITVVFLFAILSQTFASETYSQSTKLSLDFNKSKLTDVLDEIENQTEFFFLFNEKLVDINREVNISVKEQKIEVILTELFTGTDVVYSIIDRKIILVPEYLIGSLQQVSVTGKVTDQFGVPLPGVSVLVKGTAQETITNADGVYSISNVSPNTILIFSFVGMRTQEIVIGNQTVIDIIMIEDVMRLEEVVAIGYGSQKKSSATGAISSLRGEDFQVIKSGNIANALVGRTAGVSALQTGEGGTPKITIRGKRSINLSTDPLWVIDGIIGASPASLNQNDVKSIEVLKDAAATAIYGSRASNGVILVTTKSGKDVVGRETNVNFSTGLRFQPKNPENMGYITTSEDWFTLMDLKSQNYNGADYTLDAYWTNFGDLYNINGGTDRLDRSVLENTSIDYWDMFYRVGSYKDISASTSGRNEDANFYISVNYRGEEDNEKYDDPTRTLKSLLSYEKKITKNFSVKTRIQLNYNSAKNQPGGTGSFYSRKPWMPIYHPDAPERYYLAYHMGGNPMAYTNRKNQISESESASGSAQVTLDYSIPYIKGLLLTSNLNYSYGTSNWNYWYSDLVYAVANTPQKAAGGYISNGRGFQNNVYLTYDKTLNQVHHINGVAGYEASDGWGNFVYANGRLLSGTFQQMGTNPPVKETITQTRGTAGGQEALFFRATYDYDSKYFFAASVRRDGSSKFAEENRWGTFMAFSGKWAVYKEGFMKSFADAGNSLNLRVSYGEIGNSAVPSGQIYQLWGNNNNSDNRMGGVLVLGANGIFPINMANNGLQWETTKSSNAAVDFSFLDYRLSGSVDFYSIYADNMLLRGPVPVSTGIYGENTVWGNLGDMINQGVEISLSSINIQSGDFTWSTDFNIAFNKNLVRRLTPEADLTGSGMIDIAGWSINKKDHIRNEFYLNKVAGYNADLGYEEIYALDRDKWLETGETDFLFDANGDKVRIPMTSENARLNNFIFEGKSGDPKWYGGFTNTFQFKGIDLGIGLVFSGGNYIFNQEFAWIYDTSADPYRPVAAGLIDNHWKPGDGDNAKNAALTLKNTFTGRNGIPSVSGINGAAPSDRWLEKGNFLRIRDISVGYTFSKTTLSKLNMDNLRLYCLVTNPFISTAYSGWDPEIGAVSGSGIALGYVQGTGQIPMLVHFGADIKF